jgi:hypothetical protein
MVVQPFRFSMQLRFAMPSDAAGETAVPGDDF